MRLLVPCGLFIFYFVLITGSQYFTGAANSSFGLYPDEPAHFGASVLVHDYLISGFHQSPLRFAVDYYASYPFFAIGYWPPAFYAIGGFWMLIFGVGHQSAFALTAVVGALIAVTIFGVARKWSGDWGAALWGLVFVLVPGAVESCSMFMV
ncbi:MAG: hypothetical protein M3Z23_17235, partial [Acidobacteriota bacterium]|nr:hypothetical protein [Acidobacteriota bacterium]